MLPVAPSLGPALAAAHVPTPGTRLSGRVLFLSALAIGLAIGAGLIAQALTRLISFVTNLAFYNRISFGAASPADHTLGALVLVVPVLGGIAVGLLARFGSKAIRGHGIPEAMEQVLTNQSRIPARLTLLKPLSAAIAIGTGGPFGAEGPIIATGGALGSLIGQILKTTAVERKVLLAAGAAAGMAATFGTPVAAVLLAIELLLFEYRPRSLIPVALAAATATAVRFAFVGGAPVFGSPPFAPPGGAALAGYVLIGALLGLVSVGTTRAVYWIEDAFERLPIHWMWWPAIGGVAVGVVGMMSPHTLGVGYDNIESILSGGIVGTALILLLLFKFISWSIALGSGTSGGTLAPLFTIGGALGAALGTAVAALAPGLGFDPKIAALVGMAAIFAGASRALLASVVFAFEATRQPLGLLPLLGGCTAAFMVSALLMRHTIMTEKIARRGVRVVGEYAADFLEQVVVRDRATPKVVTVAAGDTLEQARAWLASAAQGTAHQGFPVVDAEGLLAGVITRKELLDPARDASARIGTLLARPAVAAFDDSSLREAVDHMVRAGVGRLPVVTRAHPQQLVGILTRSDILEAHHRRLEETHKAEQTVDLRKIGFG